MMLDIAHRHPAGIERDDHVVEAAKASLALGHQARRETAVAVPRDLQLQITDLGRDRLRRRAISRIRVEPGFGITLVIAEMLGQLGLQPALQGRFDQAGHEAALAGELHRLGIDFREETVESTTIAQLLDRVGGRTLRRGLRCFQLLISFCHDH
jgi:hypothetical protein